MKTRKIIYVALVIIMVCVLPSCAGNDNNGNGDAANSPSPSASVNDSPSPSASADSPSDSPSETGNASPSDNVSPAPSPSESASPSPSPTDSASPSPAESASPSSSPSTPPKESASPPVSPSPSPAESVPPPASPTPEPTASEPPSPTPPESGGLSGSPQELLDKLVAETTDIIKAADGFMYISFTTEVTPELSQNAAGISEADFGNYLVAAASSMAGIGSQAHQIVLYQAKDAGAAAEVKKIVAGRVNGKEGYDSMKWVCVWPEQSVVVESGAYVLMVASRKDIADAAIGVFTGMGGGIGQPDVFYEHSGA